VRQVDGRWCEDRDLFALEHNAAAARGIRWTLADGVGEFVVFVAGRVALKRADAQVFDRAGAVPGPLVVAVEDVAKVVEANAAG
jgi:hypothetical protein